MSTLITEEQRIAVLQTAISQIYTMLRSTPQKWRNFLGLARTVIAHVDATSFMQELTRTGEQSWMLAALQKLAFMDADNGAITDIAAWCAQHWLVIHQRDPQNLAALRGIGQAWLSRAQPALARIQRSDSGSSSGSSGSRTSAGNAGREDREVQQAADDFERRVGSADYVEARGFLQPATEYLERAVAAASAQQALSGDLIAMMSPALSHNVPYMLTHLKTAEAYMSLGNVSSPRSNEGQFRRALQLLRAASMIPGYTLSRYLRQYVKSAL